MSETEHKIDVMRLHPTQFVVGMKEVREKVKKIEEKSKEGKLHKVIEEHKIPAIIGLNKTYYIVDHHHFAVALHLANIMPEDKQAIVVVEQDWSEHSSREFWRRMIASNFVYLFNEKDDHPLSPIDLPKTVEGLKDDPYRSLVHEIIELGDLSKEGVDPDFFEFKWAEFFREKMKTPFNAVLTEAGIHEACHLVKSDDAKEIFGKRKK
jgi:hypothetical protein